MKYTKEQLQGMSDFDVSVALSLITENVIFIYESDNVAFPGRAWGFSAQLDHYCECPDYCNNWNDLMPLAVEHKIALTTHSGIADTWVAQYYFDAVGVNTVINDNPLRAIACCLILVLQEKSNVQN